MSRWRCFRIIRAAGRRSAGRRATTRAEAERLLDLVGMADQAQRSCGELAYGDLKRLELAIALANDPKLLLMDEPAAGMAPRERHALMGLTARIARERTIGVLFTEHDMDVVFGHADRVLVLNRGTLIAEGAPAAVRANAEVQAVYLGAGSLYGAAFVSAAKLSVAAARRRLWPGAGAVRRFARGRRRRSGRAARPQRRRQVDDVPRDPRADRSAAAARIVFDGEDISKHPDLRDRARAASAMCRRTVASSPI